MAIWAVIPAAGSGSRMRSDVPKQYLDVHGETMLMRSCNTLLANPMIDGLVVVLAHKDSEFTQHHELAQPNIVTAVGGATRSESVVAGVNAVIEKAGDEAWALVHDAARPLLSARDLLNLLSMVTQSDAAGGLLACPVNDTLKRASDNQCIKATVDRTDLWQAQTPQMFRAKALLEAIEAAKSAGVAVTDEASAMEHTGCNPLLVEAMDPNFKITRESDLHLATAWLSQQSAKATKQFT